MALIPTSATNIRLLSGIPFHADYRDVRHFNTKAEQLYWFNQKTPVREITYATFQRHDTGAYIRAPYSIDELYNVNYVHFVNPELGNKPFFAFVTKLEYVSNGMTKVHIQMDVWQTWLFDITIKPSHIEREHSYLYYTDGSPVINTQSEGLNYGTDYDTIDSTTLTPSEYVYMVVVATEQLHYSSPMMEPLTKWVAKSSVAGSPSPLYYYVLPLKRNTFTIPTTIDGVETRSLDFIMNLFANHTQVVNAIKAMYLTEWCGMELDESDVDNPRVLNTGAWGVGYLYEHEYAPFGKAMPPIYYLQSNVRQLPVKEMVYENKYGGLTEKESKFLMYPYNIIEMNDMKGNVLTLKPEYIDGQNIKIVLRGSLGTSNKISYEVDNYNGTGGKNNAFENSIINLTPQEVPIVTENLAAFIQGNRNSLEAKQKTSDISFATTAGLGIMNGFTSVAAGLSTGNPMAVVGGITGGISSIVKGAEQSFATARSINAQKQDAQNIPASVGNMGGNPSFDFGNNFFGVKIIRKRLKQEYKEVLSDYFNMYGYLVNRVKKPNIKTRKYWNFVKINGANVTGSLNNEDLMELRDIFNKGVTIWHTDDIGNYALENEVI